MASKTCGNRGFISWIVAGALATGMLATGSASMAETNWNALNTTDWGGKPAKKVQTMVGTGGGAGYDWSTAIRNAFVDLGMAEPRAACFGKVLARHLSPEDQQAAVQLVDAAASPQEVKLGVLSGGPEMVGGFSAADATCPKSMGG